MDSRLLIALEIVVAIVCIIVGVRRWTQIRSWVMSIGGWLIKIATDKKTCKVAETFFAEAAVLWFVFPILDAIYEHKSITDASMTQAYVAAIVCFVAAVALSHMAGEEK